MFALLGTVLIVAIVVGAVLFILQKLPIDATVKQIAAVVVIAIAAIWAIRLLLDAPGLP